MHFTNITDGINPQEARGEMTTIEEKLNETTPVPDQEEGELNSCVDLEKFYHLEKEYSM
jgi:hypothetical protein